MKEQTEHEKESIIVSDYLKSCIKEIEAGEKVHVTGGYLQTKYKEKILDNHCETIVRKLKSLGYVATTNHGFGCKDYFFTKPLKIEL